LADLAIAATAQKHGFTILTRNLRHFGPLGVAALDPSVRGAAGYGSVSELIRCQF
jgi:hypothetical protein